MSAVIAITPGEPAGIGPDIVLDYAHNDIDATLLCIADPHLLQQRAELLGLTIDIELIEDISQLKPHKKNSLNVLPIKLNTSVEVGKLNKDNAAYVLQCLDKAVEFIQQGHAHALVTGPLHKGIINDAGIDFTGHTEYLASLTQGNPVMMLAANDLRVALATTHLPLSQVSQRITQPLLEKVIRILHHDLITDFGIPEPRILVCGLNPHAGEDGHLGHEEIDTIEPVLNRLREQNINLTGPLPADTLFTPRYLDQANAVLAMYHDQGLPVLKHVGFGHAVNITLGLPIIRTSVDHGTALTLAGTGEANSGSLKAATELAIQLASKKMKSH